MPREFCEKCKQNHPGRTCDSDGKGECAETIDVDENPKLSGQASEKKKVAPKARPGQGSHSQ